VKEEEGYLLPSLERLVTSIEEDKTVGAECGNALAGSHFSTRGKICIPLSENSVVPTLSVRNQPDSFLNC
jgi:hypothetical protein